MKTINYLFVLLAFFFSCAEKEIKTIWIYPYRLNNVLSPYSEQGKYMLYQESLELEYSSWTIIPTENYEIRGLNFEEGFFYQVSVELEENDPSQIWRLKSILEKKQDWISDFEGAWKNVPIPGQTYFPISIAVKKNVRTLSIYGGCFSGLTGLGEVGERRIQLADAYYRLDANEICLAQNPPPRGDFSFVQLTTEYQLTADGYLEFFDSEGELLIRFEPVE